MTASERAISDLCRAVGHLRHIVADLAGSAGRKELMEELPAVDAALRSARAAIEDPLAYERVHTS